MGDQETHHVEHHIAQRLVPMASSSLIKAALHILQDGRARDAGEVLSEGVKAGLLPADTRRLTVYQSLSQYIQRAIARGRRPLIVQDETTHAYRINHPVDNWPDVKRPPRRPAVSTDALNDIVARLHSTSTGVVPEAFEAAVCEAFGMFGFVTSHIGGVGKPDGLLDAPLGPLSFRAILECKTVRGGGTVNIPRLEEPATFRKTYNAEYAILVGPAFSVDAPFESEMETHAVSVWSIEDVANGLRLGLDLLECRELFTAGTVEERLADVSWARDHGAQKRLAVIVSLLHKTAWDAQKALVGRVEAADAPALTIDAALMLVDTALQEAKAPGGATRAEVETAIADLVRAGIAVNVPGRDGVVMSRPPGS